MERLRVVGGAKLVGTVRVSGAKNSALKLMAATLLAPGQSKITNLPAIADVEYMAELLTRLGCKVDIKKDSNEVLIDVPQKLGHRADYDMVRKMRASINVLGPLIARELVAEVALPGGDAIGSRGLDFHINGLTEMGAEVSSEHGFIIAKAPDGLKGAKITLEFPSVGATENIMTAATLATGTTVIDNAAREPDVVDLGEFLISMGAKISGLGSHTITIEGVNQLNPTTHATLADRIVSGTWAFAAAMTQGDILPFSAIRARINVPGAQFEPQSVKQCPGQSRFDPIRQISRNIDSHAFVGSRQCSLELPLGQRLFLPPERRDRGDPVQRHFGQRQIPMRHGPQPAERCLGDELRHAASPPRGHRRPDRRPRTARRSCADGRSPGCFDRSARARFSGSPRPDPCRTAATSRPR